MTRWAYYQSGANECDKRWQTNKNDQNDVN